MKLQGIFADITTPFDHKGDIYKVKVQHNVEKWNRTTLAGYLVCGAAGEGALLSSEEKAAVWEMVAKLAAENKVLLAACAAPGVRETVALTRRAAELGYKAAFLDSPHHRPDTASLYFRSVADQSSLPLIVAGAEPGQLAAAAEHPNVIAVCHPQGHAARPGVQALVTSAAHLWSALESGASGAILDFAAAAPYAAISIWEAHRTREAEAGLDLQNRIRRAAELISECCGVPGLKHAMDLNAYYGGPPRLPLIVPSVEARKEIEEAFHDLKG
ncbi:MAG TPA: dihydrodipicolinate synthase family protein [Bryobacteraceae bacterium]|nr:dihydrodipicolinate synthase family protein [Bryobacteraceae bacterium]